MGLFWCSSIVAATFPSKQFELIIKQRKWDEVKKIGLRNTNYLHSINVVTSFLKSRDKCIMKYQPIEFPGKYSGNWTSRARGCYNNTIAYWNTLIKVLYGPRSSQHVLKGKRAFSKEFDSYLKNQLDSFIVKMEQIEKDLAKKEKAIKKEEKKKQEEKRILRQKELKARKAEKERKQEEMRLQLKRKKIASEKEEKKRQKAIDQEMVRINELSKSVGYSGYENIDLIRMIHKTQKEGGLENYLNKVVGCHKLDKSFCKEWYPKLKAIQILDDGVLYYFSEFSGDVHLEFTILTDKEPGKIYQEGQAFENTFHVFKGMVSYITVTGAKKSVPAFDKAKLNQ